MQTISFSVITACEATDDGRLVLRGSGQDGAATVVLPGEAAPNLMLSLHALMQKLAKVSAGGTAPAFEFGAWTLAATTDPNLVRLIVTCQMPPEAGPDTQGLPIGFSMTWPQVAELGEKLSRTARRRRPTQPRRGH